MWMCGEEKDDALSLSPKKCFLECLLATAVCEVYSTTQTRGFCLI